MSDVSIGIEFDTTTKEITYWRGGEVFNGDVEVDPNDTAHVTFSQKNQGWSFKGCIIAPQGGAPPDNVSSTTTPTEVQVTDHNTNATDGDQIYTYTLEINVEGAAFAADPKLINKPGGG